jgi:hypothetical protein
MSARSQDDDDDMVLVSGLSGAELLYLKASERKQERVSRRQLETRIRGVQGQQLKDMRESGQLLQIRQELDDPRGLTTTAVGESYRVTSEGLERVSTP